MKSRRTTELERRCASRALRRWSAGLTPAHVAPPRESPVFSFGRAKPAGSPCSGADSKMRRRWVGLSAVLLAWSIYLPLLLRAAPAWEWETAKPAPEEQQKLEHLWRDLQQRQTKTFLVVREDKILFERYAEGFYRTKPHYTASLAKALVGGMSLMVAMNDGRLSPDDLASKFIPQWASDPLKSEITLRHLATHTSGVEDAEGEGGSHESLPGWKGEFWKRLPPPRDPITLARDVVPVMEPPGTKARYSNPGMGLLGYCVTASLRGAPDSDLRALLKHRILDPLGVPEAEWSIGYRKPLSLDGLQIYFTWGGGAYSPNAVARIGRLLLRGGNWEGKQLIAKAVVETATHYAGMPNNSGLAWWVNQNPDGSRKWQAVPADAFLGAGAGHQVLVVVPSLKLIAVRNGGDLDRKSDYDQALEKHLLNPLMAVFSATPAEPPTKVAPAHHLTWAPVESIVRKAKGSDNWPMTWADDNALYTAYGDGKGFEPFVPKKLSLGFAKVVGPPADFRGSNIVSPTGEQLGNGPKGKKASGILMVDGVLYLWVRNAANSQLAWSEDHGASWTWSEWKLTNSFGCPAFLNFGRNYAGARDDYVYVFSPDADSAYVTADRYVLGRVPKNQIRDRSAYEFFVRRGGNSQPVWSRDFSQRGAVLTNPGLCYRATVSFNAGLRTYFLVQPLPRPSSRDAAGRLDTRVHGGLHIYEAPAPWGPWTPIFQAEDWDVGPGETAGFPTKWMSADGTRMFLVFSGDDSFSVREANLTPAVDTRPSGK